jgi:hypothetical protein
LLLTEYVTTVVLLGATVVPLAEALPEALPDAEAVADAEPEDCAWDCD